MKKEKHENAMKNCGYALKTVVKSSKTILPCTFLSMFCYLFYSSFIKNVFFLKKMLELITGGGTFSEFMFWLVLFCVIGIFACFCDSFGDCFASIEYKTMYKKINEMIFKKASKVDIECYENPEFFSVYKRATEVVSNSHYTTFVWCFCEAIAQCMISAILIWYVASVDVKILIFLVPIVFSLVGHMVANKLAFKRDKEMTINKRIKDYVQRVVFLKDYSKDIRTSGIYRVMSKKLKTAIENNREILKKYGKKTATVHFFTAFFSEALPVAGAFAYSAYRFIVKKDLGIADFAVLMTAISRIQNCIENIGNCFGYMQNAVLYFGNLREFMTYESKVKSGDRQADEFQCIEFKNVTFAYPGSEKNSLENISLIVNRKDTVAVVGKNGAGKSTFVKLLLRFYDVTEGEILYNGVNIKEYDIVSYRQRIGTVFQDYKVFALTVNENVLCHEAETAEDTALAEKSLSASGVLDKINTLAKKAHTVLTREFDDEGAALSGGEQQKVAAARMFAHDFDMAVLDEPSSALDPIAEYKMYESLIEATENKTVVYISHRLSSAVLSDKVYVFDNGRLAEQGTHETLMAQKGLYETMFSMQASAYKNREVRMNEA